MKIYQVDAFTNEPFKGNPAAVCILSGPANERWMQNIAQEMNLSETAFLYKEEEGFNLRWFTPTVEVDLCGHATLASAHVLWEEDILQPEAQARFYTRSGLLTAIRKGAWIELDFPAEPEEETKAPQGIADALGIAIKYIGKNRFDYLVEVDSEEIVQKMTPDLIKLREIPARGFIVTSLAESQEYDFVSRVFAPGVGINEDPVTGSAHCCLGPFWKKRLGKDKFTAYQASARGGVVIVRMDGKRVHIGGQAVTVIKGELK